MRVDVLVEGHRDVVAGVENAIGRLGQIERTGQRHVLDDGDGRTLAQRALAGYRTVGDGTELVGGVGVGDVAVHINQRVDALADQCTLVVAGWRTRHPAVESSPIGTALLALLQLHGVEDGTLEVVTRSRQHEGAVGRGIDECARRGQRNLLGLRQEVCRHNDVVADAALAVGKEAEVETVEMNHLFILGFHVHRNHGAVAGSQ